MENRRIRLEPPKVEIAPKMLEAIIESKKNLKNTYLGCTTH